jgi:hypothetical protein
MPSSISSENQISQEQKSDFYGDFARRSDQKISQRSGSYNLRDKDTSGISDSGKCCIGCIIAIVLYSFINILFRFWFSLIYFG